MNWAGLRRSLLLPSPLVTGKLSVPTLVKNCGIMASLQPSSPTIEDSSNKRVKKSTSSSSSSTAPKAAAAAAAGGGDWELSRSVLPAQSNGAAVTKKLRKTPRHLPVRNFVSHKTSNTSHVQIYGIGLDTGDTVPTVLLFFDQRRFIFNAGEGLQRFFTEHRIKLSKIDHIFLTRICSETTGGLPGLLLTLAGLGETGRAAQIWGHADIKNLVNVMRGFIPSAATVHTHSFGADEVHKDMADGGKSNPILVVEDELVKISAVCLSPLKVNLRHNDGQGESEGMCTEKTQNLEDSKLGGPTSIVYICELPEVLGKFNPEKAAAKGLKPGVKYMKLQRGESVMSDDEMEMIHPADILGPSTLGPIMILVDCPSLCHIPSLTSSESLRSFFSGSGKVVNCMVHISPSHVTCCADYQEWMSNFKEAQHIMAGRQEAQHPVLKSSARLLTKLNLVCPHVFPIPDLILKGEYCRAEQAVSASGQIVFAKNLLKFHFRPISALGIDSSLVPEMFDIKATQEDLKQASPEILEASDYVSNIWEGGGETNVPECVCCSNREEMELVFLGTCCSAPSKYRNVSSIYVHLFEQGGLLLDCGEGTYSQLRQRYGAAGADQVLLGLQCIWISHIHADHHTGLPRILCIRRQLWEMKGSPAPPILVVGPRQLRRFLDAYEKLENLCMTFLDCSQTTAQADSVAQTHKANSQDGLGHTMDGVHGFSQEQGVHLQQGLDVQGREKLFGALHLMGLRTLSSIPVLHCFHAYGVVLESNEKQDSEGNSRPGWKVAYSGDTRPCQALIEASRGATVLIHEATFDDSLEVEAVMKNHSTTKEAIEVGVSAGVYRIFLTHFSQRYPKIPVFDDSYTDRTCIAFDMMTVNLADLPWIPKILPALKMIFKDEMAPNERDGDDYAPGLLINE